jgi:hypothetical protein
LKAPGSFVLIRRRYFVSVAGRVVGPIFWIESDRCLPAQLTDSINTGPAPYLNLYGPALGNDSNAIRPAPLDFQDGIYVGSDRNDPSNKLTADS